MRAKVSWYLCSVVGGIRGHRQEKWYAGWLCTTDRVHHYPWHWHVLRHANGHVFTTFHPYFLTESSLKASLLTPRVIWDLVS